MYKVEKYIEKCLNSCYRQDIPLTEYEIICVNDGSPDQSENIAKKYALTHSNLRVIDRPNGGLSAARNTGIDNAIGEYIFFLDSDDWIADNCLKKICEQLIHEQPDILSICAANIIDDKPIRRFSHYNKMPVSGIDAMKARMSPCAPFSITKRDLLIKNNLRFLEGIFHEDSEFTPRLYYHAKKVSFINDIIYYVYQNPESITRKINPKKSYDIVDAVCPSLHNFSKDFNSSSKLVFDNRISNDINTALSHCKEYTEDQNYVLQTLLYKNRYLFSHLKNSSILKYRIEGFLFSIFPQKVISIYNLLQFFNYERGKKNQSL